MKTNLSATLILVLLLTGCSNDDATSTTPLMDNQIKSLKRAKDVEGAIQKGFDGQRRKMDGQ